MENHRTEKENATLRDDLVEFQRLHALRLEAMRLRDGGIRALLENDRLGSDEQDIPGRIRWEQPVDPVNKTDKEKQSGARPATSIHEHPVSKLIVTRTKRKAETYGLLKDFPELTPLLKMKWSDVRLPGDTDDPADCIDLDKDPLSVFTAAMYLRARLDGEEGFLSRNVLKCLYHLLDELYSVQSPDFALGGASAGLGSNRTSTYITMEAARSIGYLRAVVQRTGELATTMGEHAAYHEHIARCSNDDKEWKGVHIGSGWSKTEMKRLAEGMRSTLLANKGRVLFDVSPIEKGGDADGILAQFSASAVAFVEKTYREIDAMLTFLGPSDEMEEAGRRSEKLWMSYLFTRVFYKDLRNARNGLAQSIGFRANDETTHTKGQPTKTRLTSKQIKEMGASLCATANVLKDLQKPIEKYMSLVMHELLLHTIDGGEIIPAQEIAFAASTTGAITADWYSPSYRRAAELLERCIDHNGLLPVGAPFSVNADNSERSPVNAHTLRAMAHLYTRMQYRPKTETVQRMVRAFQHYRDLGNGLVAWPRALTTQRGAPSAWYTAVNVLALARVVRMIDEMINTGILRHFTVKYPKAPSINALMCSDLGISAMPWINRERRMITHDLEVLRRRLIQRHVEDDDRWPSLILYGPPGTGKTTLVESLAASGGAPLVEVTPGDFLVGGAEAIEYRARTVMQALSLLKGVVIIFDECDSVINDRDAVDAQQGTEPKSIFSFLTATMLPKLAELNKAASRNYCVYVLATNYIERLDAAAIRSGRFDHKRGVYPPDLGSRMSRLLSQLHLWLGERSPEGKERTPKQGKAVPRAFEPEWELRLCNVVARTAGGSMQELIKKGWFTKPDGGPEPLHQRSENWKPKNFFQYIAYGGSDGNLYPMPTEVRSSLHHEGEYKNSLQIDQTRELLLVMAQNYQAFKAYGTSDAKHVVGKKAPWTYLQDKAEDDLGGNRLLWSREYVGMREDRLNVGKKIPQRNKLEPIGKQKTPAPLQVIPDEDPKSTRKKRSAPVKSRAPVTTKRKDGRSGRPRGYR